jgi:hypothetical protein
MGNSYLLSRAFREVEAPPMNKGTSIVDAHLHRAASLGVGYLYRRAHRQSARSCCKGVGIIRLAAGCRLTCCAAALIRGRDRLRSLRPGLRGCGRRRRRNSRAKYELASHSRLRGASCEGHHQTKADGYTRGTRDSPIGERQSILRLIGPFQPSKAAAVRDVRWNDGVACAQVASWGFPGMPMASAFAFPSALR